MLSHRISSLRRSHNISQVQMAKQLNVSPSTLGMYEQGRRRPSLEVLIKMANIFDVSLDYLITGFEFAGSGNTAESTRSPELCPCSTCYWKIYKGL